MTRPQLLGQQVDETDLLPHRALVERVRREEAIEVAGAQVGDHLRWRHHANLDVAIRVQAVLGDVITQQEVVHRVFERHTEAHAFPQLRIAFVLVLHAEHDGLAVDVFQRRHDEGRLRRTQPQADGQRHRREHVRGVVFAGQRLVARHRPAGGLHRFHLQPVFGVEAHRLGHDDRRGAGDGHEADLQLGLLQRAKAVLDRRLDRIQRDQAAQNRRRDAATDHPHETAPGEIVMAEHTAHDGVLHRAIEHGFAAVGQRSGARRATLASTPGGMGKLAVGAEWIVQAIDAHRDHSCDGLPQIGEAGADWAGPLLAGSCQLLQELYQLKKHSKQLKNKDFKSKT